MAHRCGTCQRMLIASSSRAAIAGLALLLYWAAPAQAQHLVVGLHFGGPVRASLATGVEFKLGDGRRSEHGVFLVAEPGFGGDRLSAGVVSLIGDLGTLASVRGSALQIRDKGPTRRYAGLEVQFAPLFMLGARVGAFTPFGSPPGRSFMWLADVSVGL